MTKMTNINNRTNIKTNDFIDLLLILLISLSIKWSIPLMAEFLINFIAYGIPPVYFMSSYNLFIFF